MIEGSERIGLLAAELMEEIENEELPEGMSNPRVVTVGLVVEMQVDDENNPHGRTAVKFRCNDTRGWVQAGLFLSVTDAARKWGDWVKDQ